MCLENPVVRSRTLFKNGEDKITVYKRLIYDNINDEFKSLYYKNKNWVAGENISSRKSTELYLDEIQTQDVELGYHVWLNKQETYYVCEPIVAFIAYKQDYVCHERGLKEFESEVVFTKLTLTKKEMNRIRKLNGVKTV